MKNKKAKKRKFDVRLAFLLLLVSSVAIFFINFHHRSDWDGSGRLTIALNLNPILILSIDPADMQAILLTIPGNTYVEAPYGYGLYPAGSIYRLSLLDKDIKPELFFKNAIENTFAIGIDRVVFFKSEKDIVFGELDAQKIKEFKNRRFSFWGAILSVPKIIRFKKEVITDIGFVESFKIWNTLRKIRSSNIVLLKLTSGNGIEEEKLPDGQKTLTVNKELFDAFIDNRFQDQRIRKENLSVEIINAAGVEGLAQNFGRIITNMGGNVIIKTTADSVEKLSCKMVLRGKGMLNKITVGKLVESYSCLLSVDANQKSLVDIQIILGTEFLK